MSDDVIQYMTQEKKGSEFTKAKCKQEQIVVVWKRESSKTQWKKASKRKIRQIRMEVSIPYKQTENNLIKLTR